MNGPIQAAELVPHPPTATGVPAHGTMWRVELAVDRRHYGCETNPGDPNITTSWPPIVECTVGADPSSYWRCLACDQFWTEDRHWAQPDHSITPATA